MKNQNYSRTDLALEWQEEHEKEIFCGVSFWQEEEEGILLHHMEIENEEGAKATGKAVGHYVTIDLGRPWLLSDEKLHGAKKLLARNIFSLAFGEDGNREGKKECTDACPISFGRAEEHPLGQSRKEGDKDEKGGQNCILVVGLGNRKMTADAIGPLTVEKILVTRHVESLDPALFSSLHHRSVAAFCPGVLGQTGFESAESVKALAEKLRPSLLLVVDALAAKNSDRLAATVQLSTGGISPGSGVGNSRPAFTRESMGVPVLAVGVPMVVDSSTLVADALEKAGFEELPSALLPVLETGKSFFVSLKEADAATESMATLLASAIDSAMSV